MHEGARVESKQHVAPGIREWSTSPLSHRLDYSSYESPELLHARRLNVMASAGTINAPERGGTDVGKREGNKEKKQ